ncbi:(deoxy)nucleoside triphosphate pyrophosphohydrolase [Bacillus atrophaeus]|uniref:(deoxy)nucleoside triphosphate pyrophosphohydrolase n=1 Tax=Bacillus atrophaeus TaxID=1452 RepID=UPI00123C69A0|nr:(deoxy)nucleoside triphosphate pyrophosphohydrolase [Bacillus atrophaeus]KAA6449963.1 (deoxy)nucleoside triphosphate pyrophosphohydrolase [Bacillus atrophaeus]MCY7948855.1 (deoxy)nucleoside triphosphate pyrophosphohydrolase [Bacillus atrophaeus]MCY8095634.1 (deoxy)nucleoside triphosphate pyrophosphohydrolase [Bacillus atrophaeus]MCY8826006.1 (deoxy)nucleoside triphosphate pyrophosphohydrolase [Bacillus atrophaeus]MCY8840379.1 (deoxy)nucleoside triphosphate pyrophosphohydrolase [Bacillus atr
MKKTIKVAAAVIQNDNNMILCALRSPIMSLSNLWEFPGGKLEEGENAQEALVREIEEELGCKIEAGEVIADIHHEYEKVIVNLISIRAKIVDGEPVAKEHAELRWVPVSELESLEWAPADLPTLTALVN